MYLSGWLTTVRHYTLTPIQVDWIMRGGGLCRGIYCLLRASLHHVHKKLYPCICCHNSSKQSRILTKFCANNETLNCKQVTKFQQTRSTSATATASLVKWLKSISVHYRHRRDWLSSVHPCEWQDFSTSKVCVQNVHRVLDVERKLEDVDATAWPLYRWPPGGNVPTLRSGATSAGRRHESGCGTHAPAASTKSGSRLV